MPSSCDMRVGPMPEPSQEGMVCSEVPGFPHGGTVPSTGVCLL